MKRDKHPGVGFTRWLRRQCDRQDPVGQLGRFAAQDPCWVASKYRSVVIYHLREEHAGSEEMILAVFEGRLRGASGRSPGAEPRTRRFGTTYSSQE